MPVEPEPRAGPFPQTNRELMNYSRRQLAIRLAGLALGVGMAASSGGAQTPAQAAPPRQTTPGDTITSPNVLPDRGVLFRIYAPRATEVTVRSEGTAAYANQRMTR